MKDIKAPLLNSINQTLYFEGQIPLRKIHPRMQRLIDSENHQSRIDFKKKSQKFVAFEFIKYLIKHKKCYAEDILYNACRGGHIDLIRAVLENGIRYIRKTVAQTSMKGACHGGQLDLIHALIAINRNDTSLQHKTQIQKYVKLFKNGHYGFYIIDDPSLYNAGLIGACRGGHREIIDLMINIGSQITNGAFFEAMLYGHRQIANHLISLNNFLNLTECLFYTVDYDIYEYAKLLIENGATITNDVVDLTLKCSGFEVTKLILENAKIEYIPRVIERAIAKSDLRVIKLMFENNSEKILTTGLRYAIKKNKLQIAELLIEYGATNNL